MDGVPGREWQMMVECTPPSPTTTPWSFTIFSLTTFICLFSIVLQAKTVQWLPLIIDDLSLVGLSPFWLWWKVRCLTAYKPYFFNFTPCHWYPSQPAMLSPHLLCQQRGVYANNSNSTNGIKMLEICVFWVQRGWLPISLLFQPRLCRLFTFFWKDGSPIHQVGWANFFCIFLFWFV